MTTDQARGAATETAARPLQAPRPTAPQSNDEVLNGNVSRLFELLEALRSSPPLTVEPDLTVLRVARMDPAIQIIEQRMARIEASLARIERHLKIPQS